MHKLTQAHTLTRDLVVLSQSRLTDCKSNLDSVGVGRARVVMAAIFYFNVYIVHLNNTTDQFSDVLLFMHHCGTW